MSAEPLVPPIDLMRELPLPEAVARTVRRTREEIRRILDREDDRLLVLVGPCSIHDPLAAIDYAARLASLAADLGDRLRIVMRAYLEKPRTGIGWPGLIHDPRLDGSGEINEGLRIARGLLLDIVATSIPVGCEFLDPLATPYLADAVSWGCIGARTAESQVHRQLASGLPMPVGIKNSTGGDLLAAVDAVRCAAEPQVRTGIDPAGRACVLRTGGNRHGHVVLRGSCAGPNYDPVSVSYALARLRLAGQTPRVVIDASHGNSDKDHRRQPAVVRDLADRVATGEPGIVGVMMEGFLIAGRQRLEPGNAGSLRYGQSITDGCLDWADTAELLHRLAEAVCERRTGITLRETSLPLGRNSRSN